ncbi:TetR/AcrR family transcriptional regulator C-terminal domain-containing protein [Streptomyces huasconensis]|uniref:TetR/AcrR family transcriptional regulator C-terminal domain-containing protein n=1 Tax=Streptomyces huasconensis TaxID=1854574 RepID=UPI0033C51115
MKAPALYWHFKDKQALPDEMVTEMMRRMAEDFPAAPAADWREVVTGAMRALRGHLLRYRDGAKVFSGTHYTDLSYAAPLEAFLRTLVEAGFTPGPERGYDLAARAERLAAYPPAAATGEEMFAGHDRGFEAGLAAVVAGVGATLVTAGE